MIASHQGRTHFVFPILSGYTLVDLSDSFHLHDRVAATNVGEAALSTCGKLSLDEGARAPSVPTPSTSAPVKGKNGRRRKSIFLVHPGLPGSNSIGLSAHDAPNDHECSTMTGKAPETLLPGEAGQRVDVLALARDYAGARRAGYLNAAAVGLICAPVLARHEAFARDLAERGSAAFFDHADAILKGPREAGARLFGADPGSVAATTSVSEAISQVAWWLRPRAGQNVVSIDIEPEAVTFPWLRVAEDTGAEVRLASLRDDPASLSLDKIAALVDRNTVAICLSHVQWITGYRFDLKALADLAHAHGALLIVDAMQSAGVVPIDVQACDVDVLVAGSYKWLCSFGGVAACYLRPELLERFRPVMVGARTSDPMPPYDDIDPRRLNLPDDARRLEYASTAHPSRIAFSVAVDYLLDIGIEKILAHTQMLGSMLAEGLLKLGARVITPMDEQRRAAILSAAFPQHSALSLARQLAEQGVAVSPRLGLLRFSPHVFNDEEDIERALSTLARIL